MIDESDVKKFKEEKQRQNIGLFTNVRSPIMVGNKTLKEYVGEEEEKEEAKESKSKGSEIARERKETMQQQDKAIYRECRIDPLHPLYDQVPSAAVNLSDNQIRKEYGLMSKPYPTVAENIIYLINEKGPITARAISYDLKKPLANISGPLSYVCAALAGNIKKEKAAANLKAFNYSFRVKYDEEGMAKAAETVRKYTTAIKKGRKPPTGGSGVVDKPKKEKLAEVEETEKAEKDWKKRLERALSQSLGVTVKVEGEIKLLFGFVKE